MHCFAMSDLFTDNRAMLHNNYSLLRFRAAKLAAISGIGRSEDRKIRTAMIGRSLGIGMVGSDISCIITNSTQISIARTTVTACHRSQRSLVSV